jgi:hypothetical protein
MITNAVKTSGAMPSTRFTDKGDALRNALEKIGRPVQVRRDKPFTEPQILRALGSCKVTKRIDAVVVAAIYQRHAGSSPCWGGGSTDKNSIEDFKGMQ